MFGANASQTAPQTDRHPALERDEAISTTLPTLQAETHRFALHQAILTLVISHQSGSPQKAILELLMNSVDAGATKVSVVLTETGFTVSDNGRGLADRDDLLRYWGTFGTPHEHGDATYGVFRIGRGQAMALAKLRCRTRTWEMHVDHRHRPGEFDLLAHPDDQPGMTVEGEWYPSVKRRGQIAKWVATEVGRLCRWMAVAIDVNGLAVSTAPAARTWGHADALCYADLALDEPLKIYNQGALVLEFPPSRYGIGGEVVSRKPLALNTARTDVLWADCPVWAHIEQVIEAARGPALLDGHLARDSQRQALLGMYHRGEVTLPQVLDKPLLTLAGGTPISLRQLAEADQVGVARPAESNMAERLQEKATVITTAQTARVLGLRDADDLVGFLKGLHRELRALGVAVGKAKPITNIRREYEKRVARQPLFDVSSDLTKAERLKFDAIATRQTDLVAALRAVGLRHLKPRTVVLARLMGALAETDSERKIRVDTRWFKECAQDAGGLAAVLNVLVHEYGHHARQVDAHDFDFYKSVHDALVAPVVTRTIHQIVRAAG